MSYTAGKITEGDKISYLGDPLSLQSVVPCTHSLLGLLSLFIPSLVLVGDDRGLWWCVCVEGRIEG